jgi:hypothetical protein
LGVKVAHSPCSGCPNGDAYRILLLCEDYVLVQCPSCGGQYTLVVGQDTDR